MVNHAELREFVKDNPDMKTNEIVERFGCTNQNVYSARHDVGVSKPLTMTKMKRLKVVRKSTIVSKDARIAQLERQIEALQYDSVRVQELTDQVAMLKVSPNEKNVEADSEWEQKHNAALYHINHLEKKIDGFEKQVIGYKAVINYLEHQLSAMAEKHGSSV
jgi:polyhydroxyalkanoate synthesis regulator phasin